MTREKQTTRKPPNDVASFRDGGYRNAPTWRLSCFRLGRSPGPRLRSHSVHIPDIDHPDRAELRADDTHQRLKPGFSNDLKASVPLFNIPCILGSFPAGLVSPQMRLELVLWFQFDQLWIFDYTMRYEENHDIQFHYLTLSSK